MIDRLTRDRYAELLRRFIAGQVTNFEYEDRFDQVAIDLDIADPAVDELFRVMWSTYCDIREHKMTGDHTFEGENRKTVLRFLLFLHSDCPYEWPTEELSGCLLSLLTLGLYGKLTKPDPASINGDEEVWPFYRKGDYEHAVRHPKLLNGRRQPEHAADG